MAWRWFLKVGNVIPSFFATCPEFIAFAKSVRMRCSCPDSDSMGAGRDWHSPIKTTCFDSSIIFAKVRSASLRLLMS